MAEQTDDIQKEIENNLAILQAGVGRLRGAELDPAEQRFRSTRNSPDVPDTRPTLGELDAAASGDPNDSAEALRAAQLKRAYARLRDIAVEQGHRPENNPWPDIEGLNAGPKAIRSIRKAPDTLSIEALEEILKFGPELKAAATRSSSAKRSMAPPMTPRAERRQRAADLVMKKHGDGS